MDEGTIEKLKDLIKGLSKNAAYRTEREFPDDPDPGDYLIQCLHDDSDTTVCAVPDVDDWCEWMAELIRTLLQHAPALVKAAADVKVWEQCAVRDLGGMMKLFEALLVEEAIRDGAEPMGAMLNAIMGLRIGLERQQRQNDALQLLFDRVAKADKRTPLTDGAAGLLMLGDMAYVVPKEIEVAFEALRLRAEGGAPSCSACGAITVRSGAMYKCLNCGASREV